MFPLDNSANTTIENTPVGVYNNWVNTDVNDVSMTGVSRGVFSEGNFARRVNVTGCNISADFRGIDWENNDRAINMTATGNTIKVTKPNNAQKGGTVGIFMSETNPANFANYIIGNPDISTYSADAGIMTFGVNRALIQYNTINTYMQGALVPATAGIYLGGGGNNTVDCNTANNFIPVGSNTFP
ncbi:MAG: hypothetical protein ABI855_16195 [Bacteroidota bacterium]